MSAIRQKIDSPKKVVVGPEDDGRPMSLADFEFANTKEGYLYELERGVVIVSDVPDLRHFLQVNAIRDQIHPYKILHPQHLALIAGGGECKLLMPDFDSERHPDLAIYKKRPPKLRNPWRSWIPDIVIEVVSRSSIHRDYEEKREEYLRLGVKEYWIFDADQRELLVLRRVRGRWLEKVVKPPQLYRTRLLSGFELACAKVFKAAEAAGH